MNLRALRKPFLFYTGLLGLLTVGAIYLATHSGLYILISAGAGIMLVVLGGGTAGPMSASGVGSAEEAGGGVEIASLRPQTATDTSLRLVLLLYGLGVFLWSLGVLAALRDTLV